MGKQFYVGAAFGAAVMLIVVAAKAGISAMAEKKFMDDFLCDEDIARCECYGDDEEA